MKQTTGYMPTTNKSTLVYGTYKGFRLPEGKSYRPSNIDKANSLLAIAIDNDHNCYSFEIYDEDFLKHLERFKTKLEKIDSTARYLKVCLDTHIQLVVFWKFTEAELITLLEQYMDADDFALQTAVIDVEENAEEAASVAYQLAEHYLIPKPAKKAKQMSGNDLTPEEKAMSVVFELKPTVVRRS